MRRRWDVLNFLLLLILSVVMGLVFGLADWTVLFIFKKQKSFWFAVIVNIVLISIWIANLQLLVSPGKSVFFLVSYGVAFVLAYKFVDRKAGSAGN